MRANRIYPTPAMWSGATGVQPLNYSNITFGIQSPISGSRGSTLWPSNTRLDELIPALQYADANRQSISGGRERTSGSGSANGRFVRSSGGRSADGAPQFNQAVDPGNYLWWYVDALSDDGQHGISIIAFVGSVFSPYYAWANRSQPADADDYCALNVAIYSPGNKRWTMTERGGKWIQRDQHTFQIGPSGLHWDGSCLTISIAERAIPFGQKVAARSRSIQNSYFSSPRLWMTQKNTAGVQLRHRPESRSTWIAPI
jgi:carotenoid 1,2-hydratase